MKIFKHISAALILAAGFAFGLSSCSEDDVYNVDINGVPQASQFEDMVSVTVDQATNTATFSFTGKGVYPVWIIDGKSYTTMFNFQRFYRKAGDYNVEVKIGNANGVSTGTITKTFHIDKTQMSGFGGFVYDSEFNLWNKATKEDPTFFYAPGWAQIADPAWSFDGDAYTVTLPQATTDQWQAQMHIGTDICLTKGERYDGSFIFTATKDIKNVTLKIHPKGDDENAFYPNQKVNLAAGEPITYWFSDTEAPVDMNNLVFTLDFGGNPENISVTVENFVLKKHSDDDGTVLPDLPSTPEPTWVDVDSPLNLWSTCSFTNSFYYAPGWAQIADPVLDFSGRNFTVSLPTATFEQWQAQVAFNTDIAVPDTNEPYDFCINFESNVDLNNVMVKLVQTDEGDTKHDNNFFFAETINIPANTPVKFWQASVKAPEAMHAVSLVLDFGGNPDGTEVKVSNIIFQKHHD